MGKRTSPTHALIAGFVAATWFELVYFAGRPLSEAVATTVLLIGLSLASVSDKAGGLIPVAVFGATDWITYGAPFQSYIEYVRIHLTQGVTSSFGVSPPEWYFQSLWVHWKYALPVVAMLVALRTRTSMIWIATAMAIIVSHSIIR